LLQSLNLRTNGRLREIQFFGCVAETSVFAYRDEGTEQFNGNVTIFVPKMHYQGSVVY
jgi:hypothetical protein